MKANQPQLSEKHKMLAFALHARGVSRSNAASILLTLETEDMVDDLTWYMTENPSAPQEELVAVAFQIYKEAHE